MDVVKIAQAKSAKLKTFWSTETMSCYSDGSMVKVEGSSTNHLPLHLEYVCIYERKYIYLLWHLKSKQTLSFLKNLFLEIS